MAELKTHSASVHSKFLKKAKAIGSVDANAEHSVDRGLKLRYHSLELWAPIAFSLVVR